MAKKKEAQEAVNTEETAAIEEAAKTEVLESCGDINELKSENEKLKDEAVKFKETAQRIQAEFDNYRRRSLADNEQCKVKASAAVVNTILPGLDSIDEAIKLYRDKEDKKELAEGFERVQKQFLDALGTIGVTVMECEGKDFDPNLHEAVMMQECEDKDSGIILNVFRKGYIYKDSVVRHAQVIVSK